MKKCYVCYDTKDLTEHHIEPKGLGGMDIPFNKEDLCLKCHKRLHDKAKKPKDLNYMKKRLENMKKQYKMFAKKQ